MNKLNRISKHKTVRKKIVGTKIRPRLSVFRSGQHIYAQIINDSEGKTLVGVSDIKVAKGTKQEKAFEIGKTLAENAVKLKIKKVVFDRGGFLYQGRVAKLAQGAREGGLEF
jgi:large subunit ribosomal protein L18